MNALPRLPGILSSWIQDCLTKEANFNSLLTELTAPLEVLNTSEFESNVANLRATFEKHALPNSKIYFARKANPHPCFIRAAKVSGIGLDVTSLAEVEELIKYRFSPDRILLSSAVKTVELVELCGRHAVTVVVDSIDELELFKNIEKKPPILARISGWKSDQVELYSRFGISEAEFSQFASTCQALALDIQGVHFHLRGYSLNERVAGVEVALEKVIILRQLGFKPRLVDIGGGIPVRYLSSKEDWIAFQHELQRALLDERDEVTFDNDGLGYFCHDRKIYGSATYYPFWSDLVKENFIDAILSSRLSSELTVAQSLKAAGVELQLEPGRALLDQCGCLLAKVAFTKCDSAGHQLVGLFMNKSQLMSSSSEFCVDPHSFKGGGDIPTYVVGSYCVENDIILKRKILLPRLARNDLILFPNTAAYLTSLYASNSHHLGGVHRIEVQDLNF